MTRCLTRRAAYSMLCLEDKKRVRTGAVELGKVLTPKSPILRVLQAGKKRVRTGAVELGKMLTAESRLLCVVPAGKKRVRTGAVELGKVLTPGTRIEAGENRCNGTGQGAYPLTRRAASSMLCPAGKRQVRSGAWNWARCLPRRAASSKLRPAGKRQVRENRCNGTGQGAYPGEPLSPCCARRTRSG